MFTAYYGWFCGVGGFVWLCGLTGDSGMTQFWLRRNDASGSHLDNNYTGPDNYTGTLDNYAGTVGNSRLQTTSLMVMRDRLHPVSSRLLQFPLSKIGSPSVDTIGDIL